MLNSLEAGQVKRLPYFPSLVLHAFFLHTTELTFSFQDYIVTGLYKLLSPSTKTIILAGVIVPLLFACSSPKKVLVSPPSDPTSKTKTATVDKIKLPATLNPSLYSVYKEYEGTKYKYGGRNKKGIDCSAFTQILFKEVYGINLERTVARQRKQGKAVKTSEMRTGDLVFFKIKRRVSHVGIYIKNGDFIHASTKIGVSTSNLKNIYWRNKIHSVRRVI